MISSRFYFHTFSFFMSLFMTAGMSLAILAIELRDWESIILGWPRTWFISMLVAFPMSLFVVPLTEKVVAKLVSRSEEDPKTTDNT